MYSIKSKIPPSRHTPTVCRLTGFKQRIQFLSCYRLSFWISMQNNSIKIYLLRDLTTYKLYCIKLFSAMVQVDMKDIISDSHCYQRCDYVQYDNEVEFIKHQRHLEWVCNIVSSGTVLIISKMVANSSKTKK